MHPRVPALVLVGNEEYLDPVGSELAGCRLDVVYEESGDWAGREVAVDITFGSEDLHLAAIRQFHHAEPW